jgi:hypothetical protein
MSLEQYKNATRKELWEILQIQVERIAELEKERDELNIQVEVLKHSDAEYYGLYSELLFSPNEPPENLEAHNLEQQEKGVEGTAKEMNNIYVTDHNSRAVPPEQFAWWNRCFGYMNEKAKAPKEQVK